MAGKERNILSIVDRKSYVVVDVFVSSAADILKDIADASCEYQVIAHFFDKLKMGWYRNGKIVFDDGSSIDDRYLLQLRAFNLDEEILLKKTGHNYWMRKISDTDGKDIRTVDSTSTIFGNRVSESGLPDDFEMVFEPGRKVKLILPVKCKNDKYCVTTRSYVTYDEKTGQAGYGYYRYVAIDAERR